MAYIKLLGCCLGNSSMASLTTGEEHEEILEKNLGNESDEGANYQQDLWQFVLQKKLSKTQRSPPQLMMTIPADSSTAEDFLQNLTAAYNRDGFSQKMPRVREIFQALQPFVSAINTMVQANSVASLVWGTVTLAFESVMRFSNLFEDTSQMLLELSKSLPRLNAYAEIFHTPPLHQALRDVYEGFVDFCFRTSEVLQTNKCCAIMKGRWAAVDKEFLRTKERLIFANCEFEKELRLADVQEQSRRHAEILSNIRSIPSGRITTISDLITNITLPRNERFTGRESVLALLHSELALSVQQEIPLRARCSCVVHAVGGMGKTEIALEYTYRYRHCYSHVFWLRAQTASVLLDSFLDVVDKLDLDVKGMDPEKRVQIGLQWFQTTKSLWLLIFDNVEDFPTIKRFWPASHRGAIIVTSQNPVLAQSTKSEIHLQPLQPTEGSALIQSYLKRGGSEQESAQNLSKSLGGLPLAIAHFAGYVAKSQCPLDQICDSFERRIKSSQIWNSDNVLQNNSYDFTLNTVWDLAFHRLSTDSKMLLEFIAFLDPDQVPVEMFVGSNSAVNRSHWQHWDRERFDAAIGILLERHLVERYNLPSGDCLKTHRALQRTIIQRLDTDLPKRQSVFNQVVAIAREAFPAANILTRGDTSQYKQSATYMPQILSIHTNFKQSDPAIEKELEFAKLLSDVGYYGVNNALQSEALDLLQTGDSICTALLQSRPKEVRPILADILGPLQVLLQYLGIDGRHRALEINKRAIQTREQQLAEVPPDQLTKLDFVNLARAHNDMGVSLSQLNRIEEASPWFDSALQHYQLAGDEQTLTARFGHIYSFQLWPLAIKQKKTEARTLAQRSISLVAEAVGADSPLALQTKFLVAMVLFTTGCIDDALNLHKEVLEKRLIRQGTSHHLTLASQYNLAVCYQNLGDLEKAEIHLRDNLTNSCVTAQWRNEDIVRTKFRMSLVLHAQKKSEEASTVQQEIASSLESLRSGPLSGQPTYGDEDDMKQLDFGVAIFHGRTAGIWSNGVCW